MKEQDCIAIIRYECIADRGFLATLREREFSHAHYNKLLKALQVYRELIRELDQINREVACCIYYLDLDLRGAMDFFPRTEGDRKLINEVQLECSNLILEILTPEYMMGSIPDELLE